jgi:hypothetical protein
MFSVLTYFFSPLCEDCDLPQAKRLDYMLAKSSLLLDRFNQGQAQVRVNQLEWNSGESSARAHID